MGRRDLRDMYARARRNAAPEGTQSARANDYDYGYGYDYDY